MARLRDPSFMELTMMFALKMKSPVGMLTLVSDDEALTAVQFEGDESGEAVEAVNPILQRAQRQLNEYFAGARKEFDLPLKPRGTPFQCAVWKALLNISYGKTASYLDIAKHVKNPKAMRAVGAANGRNPIALIIPCHRVIGSDGSLTGYGGGMERKRWLLEHEGVVCAREGLNDEPASGVARRQQAQHQRDSGARVVQV